MAFSEAELRPHALVARLQATREGSAVGTVFGQAAGLEAVNAVILDFYDHDAAKVREFTYLAASLLVVLIDQRRVITFRDVDEVMGTRLLPDLEAVGPERPPVEATMAAALAGRARNVYERVRARSGDAIVDNSESAALEMASWLGVALARLEGAGRVRLAEGARSSPSSGCTGALVVAAGAVLAWIAVATRPAAAAPPRQ